MTQEDEYAIFGALTACSFMIENLYAFAIAVTGGTATDARATRDEILRQFEDLPDRGNLAPSDYRFVVHQHAVARLESMWTAIEARVAQVAAARAPE